jgi:hypothetical protein
MREAGRISERDRPDGRTRHAKGDIVICTSCARPLYQLERGISLGDKVGSAADAFAPVTPAILKALGESPHVDAGLTAWARGLTDRGARAHCESISRPRRGDPMLCGLCGKVWAQVLTAEVADTMDRAYTVELVTVPLTGRAPSIFGRDISAGGGWLH